MKVAAGRVDGFVAKPDPSVAVFLFYGPDAGLVHERARRLALQTVDALDDPFRVAELTSASIADTPARLADEMLAVSFGGGERLVIVRDGADSLTNPLKAALAEVGAGERNAVLVIEAGNLAARSTLRKFCEGSDLCAALPCYPDDEEGRGQLVRSMIEQAGLGIEPGALRLAAEMLGENRQSNRREIEKLVLYVGESGTVGEDDVLACIGDAGSTSLDETIYAAADGNIVDLDLAIERFWADGGEPIGLMRGAQRHFQRLHRVATLLAQGESYDSAAGRLRPPVFWKVKNRFQNQSRRWSQSALEQALLRLTDAELALKTTGTPGRAACGRTLYAIASMRRN